MQTRFTAVPTVENPIPRTNHRWIAWWIGLFFVVAATSMGRPPASASEVVLLGDSWGVGIDASVRGVLNVHGLASVSVHNASVNGSRASQWNANAFGSMAQILTSDADAKLVHLIVGGNDLLGGLSNPAQAVQQAKTNIIGILISLAAATPAPILYSGYDYLPNPPGGLTTEAVNRFLDDLVNGVKEAVLADPTLQSRVTVMNTHGLMQVQFGVPQRGIPPFDPTLPDPTLPGPSTAFSDAIHLTRAGYDILAHKLITEFHEPILKRSSLFVLGPGRIQIRSRAGLGLQVISSHDLLTWTSLGTVTNLTGIVEFEDPEPVSTAARCFYKVVTQ